MATSSSLRSPCERPPARVRAWASSRKSASTSVASCHTGRSASASDSSRRVLPWREKMASATLSSALSWSKRLTSWNDRAIPARIRSLTGCFVTSWPRKRMWPSSAVSSPLIRLTSVVLPAPLEPMRASTSPSCTRKSTRSTARNSPNCFTTAFVSSSTLIDRRGGPRYGPPHPPSLGRAPAQPWRASGLTQDVSSSLHHERAVPIDLEGEARRHHDRRGRQRDDRGPREPRAGAERLAVEDVGVGEGGLLGHPGATAATARGRGLPARDLRRRRRRGEAQRDGAHIDQLQRRLRQRIPVVPVMRLVEALAHAGEVGAVRLLAQPLDRELVVLPDVTDVARESDHRALARHALGGQRRARIGLER